MSLAEDEAILVQYRGLLRRRSVGLALLGVALCLASLADFSLGPSGLGWQALGETLLHPLKADPAVRVIVWELRLPATLMAVAVGAALGHAGAEMQTILDNPLASPFTLGVCSAAALGASLAIVLGLVLPGLAPSWVVPVNAFLFALASALLLDAVARRNRMGAAALILLGIALVFSFNAAISLVQYVASAEALQNLVFWTMGSLSQASWPRAGLLLLAYALILPLSLRMAWRLTALRLGDERAASFGVDVARLRRATLLRVSLLAALAVSFAGTIGFVGLIAPHMARRLFGEDHRFYLPGSALIGGLILSLASIASRVLVPGVVLPVGIVTSLVGVPFFLMVTVRHPPRG